jgi:hypothetical protein
MTLMIIPCARQTLNGPASSVHIKCVRVIAIRRIVSVEDCLNTEERSTSSGTDTVDYHEILQGLSVRTVPIIVRYHLRSHFMTAVMTSALADICTVHG